MARQGDPVRVQLLALEALSTSASPNTSNPIKVNGYNWIDFTADLTDAGAASITNLYFQVEFSTVESPSAEDWSPVYREEFETSGSGVATLSVYTPNFAGPDVPGCRSITLRPRGELMRVKVFGDDLVSDVDVTVGGLRR